MTSWWRRPPPEPPSVIEHVEAVEIPVITEVKRRLAKGDYEGALLYAYPIAAEDLSKAFRAPFPPGMTHEEFLASTSGHELGHLPEFFRRFYDLYAPVRYGPPGHTAAPAALSGLLKSIYAQRPMWKLYLQPKHLPPDGGTPAEAPPPAATPGEPSA